MMSREKIVKCIARVVRGCKPRLLICRLRSPDRNRARFQTAPTGYARSGSGDPELQTLAARFCRLRSPDRNRIRSDMKL